MGKHYSVVLMDRQYGHWTCATNRTFVVSPLTFRGRKVKKKLIVKKEKSDGDNETKEISSLSCSH